MHEIDLRDELNEGPILKFTDKGIVIKIYAEAGYVYVGDYHISYADIDKMKDNSK